MRRNCKVIWLSLIFATILCLANQWSMELPAKSSRGLGKENFGLLGIQPLFQGGEYVDNMVNKGIQRPSLPQGRLTITPNETDSNHQTLSPKDRWLEEMNATQSRRIQNLRRVCHQQHLQVADLQNSHDLLEIKSNTPPLDAFVFDDNFEFMVSVIQKVGSKHWRNLFSDLRRRGKNYRHGSNRVRKFPNGALLSQVKDIRELKFRLQNYKKILFTRHPLVRALSAYRDKFENNIVDHCWSVGSIILNKYRRNYTGLDVKRVHDISFSEFVEFITDPNAPDEKNDRHWVPISRRSNPCRIAYDVLGKLETINDDMNFVLEYLGVQGLVKYNAQQETRSSRTETIKHYFSQLSPRLFSRIIDLYGDDFEMFGYRVPKDRHDFDNLVIL